MAEHWANRDDLGMATQLGWIPPTPAFLWRMARPKRQARRNPAVFSALSHHKVKGGCWVMSPDRRG